MSNSAENANDFCRREKIFRGHRRWRDTGNGTPQVLPEGKQLNRFKFLPFSLLISDCQAEIIGVLETEIMFLNVNALESGYAQNNKLALFRHGYKTIIKKMHNLEFISKYLSL